MAAPVLNQHSLCEALHLTPEEARALPHRVESTKLYYSCGSYTTHLFNVISVSATPAP